MGDRLLKGGSALLIRHLEEEQKRQLLDVVAVRQPVIAQDVAVVPEFLNELRRLFCHVRRERNYSNVPITNEEKFCGSYD